MQTELKNKFMQMMAGDIKDSSVPQQQTNPLPSEPSFNKAVIVTRYMLEVTRYPNGNEYTKCWVVNTGERIAKYLLKPFIWMYNKNWFKEFERD
jgi:hypothetical protein